MVFFVVKFFFSFRSTAEFFFSWQVVSTLFFFYKNIFFKAQSANRIYFFCPLHRQNFFFNQICRQNFFPQKTIAPFKLNGWNKDVGASSRAEWTKMYFSRKLTDIMFLKFLIIPLLYCWHIIFAHLLEFYAKMIR